jgi:hypothetical protein
LFVLSIEIILCFSVCQTITKPSRSAEVFYQRQQRFREKVEQSNQKLLIQETKQHQSSGGKTTSHSYAFFQYLPQLISTIMFHQLNFFIRDVPRTSRFEMLYSSGVEKKKSKEMWAAAENARREAALLAECSFKPNLAPAIACPHYPEVPVVTVVKTTQTISSGSQMDQIVAEPWSLPRHPVTDQIPRALTADVPPSQRLSVDSSAGADRAVPSWSSNSAPSSRPIRQSGSIQPPQATPDPFKTISRYRTKDNTGLYQRNKEWQQRLLARTTVAQEARQRKEVENCTFRPKIKSAVPVHMTAIPNNPSRSLRQPAPPHPPKPVSSERQPAFSRATLSSHTKSAAVQENQTRNQMAPVRVRHESKSLHLSRAISSSQTAPAPASVVAVVDLPTLRGPTFDGSVLDGGGTARRGPSTSALAAINDADQIEAARLTAGLLQNFFSKYSPDRRTSPAPTASLTSDTFVSSLADLSKSSSTFRPVSSTISISTSTASLYSHHDRSQLKDAGLRQVLFLLLRILLPPFCFLLLYPPRDYYSNFDLYTACNR